MVVPVPSMKFHSDALYHQNLKPRGEPLSLREIDFPFARKPGVNQRKSRTE